ncbi:bifunctional adenosylcobinamide kinase/adenosylcobinamide-phosphate guanylyltransferase [Thermodesulforhabdus norvegica]|uniref:Adenosylcobinamide kinase n=1 Tax=Thermodesulforhabdus norvegica TaxID=39841 RepID=A0A1I4RAS8_9BACT|nr:bifunctional adenosylcobinamide kinase/adenosylcobinamide-phosphate guanylyltransferase [Thermodesulforhabdus norvegica]SFM49319.1 adenosylcobinamide kinase /adenosylcobinamide-phosphate guanylyltransferase [Thermodesulforhabdus norvegica]
MKLFPGVHLVIGGARSGKSLHAEKLALTFPAPRVYLATSLALDRETAERIAAHRKRRGSEWTTVEEPYRLADALERAKRLGNVVLVDCVTMWLTNLLLSDSFDAQREVDFLCNLLAKEQEIPIIVVSNEVGLGIVPENELARSFRDLSGITNQKLADLASTVTWMVAGIPVVVKDGHPE